MLELLGVVVDPLPEPVPLEPLLSDPMLLPEPVALPLEPELMSLELPLPEPLLPMLLELLPEPLVPLVPEPLVSVLLPEPLDPEPELIPLVPEVPEVPEVPLEPELMPLEPDEPDVPLELMPLVPEAPDVSLLPLEPLDPLEPLLIPEPGMDEEPVDEPVWAMAMPAALNREMINAMDFFFMLPPYNINEWNASAKCRR